MICPHCRISFHDTPTTIRIGVDADGGWLLTKTECSSCKRLVLELVGGPATFLPGHGFYGVSEELTRYLVRPKASSRPPCPLEVPPDLAADYTEACLVLSDSPKASAALGRRCLQHLLREAAGVKPGDLANEIQQVLDSQQLASQLTESIDAVRNIGNFSAHPLKSKSTGEILPVEPHEAEWTLDVLESLFDHFYVQPELLKRKRDALNAKLATAGKPPLK